MGHLSIQLFGKLTIQVDGHRINGFDSRKNQELLTYLLVYRDRPHTRESLAEMLWQGSSTSQSKKYLRQALWQIQQLLPIARLILTEPDWIRISPEISYWLDVAEFERAYAQSEGVAGHPLDEPAAMSLDKAAALYRGDLLEGWYLDWCLYERERLQIMWLAMLDKLMSHCEATGQYEAGLSYGTRALRDDRAHERIHRRMMRLAYKAGDRTSALRQYERCVQALKEELGVGPGRLTVALHRRILNDATEIGEILEPKQPNVATMSRLDQLREILTQLHDHVSEDLDALDHAFVDSD